MRCTPQWLPWDQQRGWWQRRCYYFSSSLTFFLASVLTLPLGPFFLISLLEQGKRMGCHSTKDGFPYTRHATTSHSAVINHHLIISVQGWQHLGPHTLDFSSVRGSESIDTHFLPRCDGISLSSTGC